MAVTSLYSQNFYSTVNGWFQSFVRAEAIRELAQHTEAVKLKFQEFAISYNINIITGSMPL
jgi:SNF family Na+-dependent transporter